MTENLEQALDFLANSSRSSGHYHYLGDSYGNAYGIENLKILKLRFNALAFSNYCDLA